MKIPPVKIPQIKIPDLSKIDIKDIDINRLKDLALEQKEWLIQIGIGVVTFFWVVSTISGSMTEVKKYKDQIQVMSAKSPSIALYKKSQSDIEMFLKNLPPSMAEGPLISLVTDLTDKNKVKIMTFLPSPPKNENKKMYTETSALVFTMQTQGFKNVVQLISDIENSNNMLQVRSCVIQAVTPDLRNSQKVILNFKMEVASLDVKK